MSEQQRHENSLGAALLREETHDETKYEEYRMSLELALNRAQRRERIAFHVCWVSMLVAMVLMFVGGSGVVGSFDPYDDTATPLSITLAVIWTLANVAWPLSLASVYSRFRPRIRHLKQDASDARIDQLERSVEKLRERLDD